MKFLGNINYYRRASGLEVDFVLNKEIAYEVKTGATLTDVSCLGSRIKTIKVRDFFVVSKNYTEDLTQVVFGQFL